MGQEADFGKNITDSFAKLDPDGCSWRTYQHSLFGGLELFSRTWPRQGMIRNGLAYPLPPLALLTEEIEFGYWPTPCAAAEAPNLGSNKKNGPKSLIQVARENWPTPTVKGNYNRKGASKTSGNGLATAVKMWPTPTACEWKGRGPNSKQQGLAEKVRQYPTPKAQDSRAALHDRGKSNLGEVIHEIENVTVVSGRLNPTWVEWLMGLPIGWSDLNCSATAKSLSASNLSQNK